LKIRKRNWLVLLAVIIVIGIVSFALFRDPYYSLKKDVWNQLNDSYKSTVSSDWKSAKVVDNKVDDEIIVEFDAGKSSILGNIKAHIDPKTHKILSIDGRA